MNRVLMFVGVCFSSLLLLIVTRPPEPSLAAGELKPAQPTVNSPVSPEEGIQLMEIDPAVRVELVASEPDVVDPVAIAFDASLRMWVVEMRDYPHGPAEGEKPKSRIKILEDTNGDGRYETVHIFADELLFATGVMPWKDGAIVTLAGEVVFMKDTDGDNIADVREQWFSGFTAENPQLRANHPTFGLNRRVYIANGLRGGTVQGNTDKWGGEQPVVPISGMDFRFDPSTGAAEAISGIGQFGLTFNDFGDRFVCSNRNPCSHIILEDHYLKRNPFFAAPAVVHDVSPAGPDSAIFAISARPWTTSTLHAGQFTAACGLTIYRGTLLPERFYGNSFTCDPTGNLIHCDIHSPEGPTFDSQPSAEGVEFLASRDEWFRAVNLTTGPDGALYVCDMHRAVIEHPDFMPDELKKRPDLLLGTDRGRIYRVVAADAPTGPMRDRVMPLNEATPEQLAASLGHANGWQRDTAARLLFERREELDLGSLVPRVKELALKGKTSAARVQALWVLDGWNLDESKMKEVVQAALDDADPRVQEQAVILSERWLERDQDFASHVAALADSPDSRLRFQVALSLGYVADLDVSYPALAQIARHGIDRWTGYAILSSVSSAPGRLLNELNVAGDIAQNDFERYTPQYIAWIRQLGDVIGAKRDPDEVQAAVDRLASWVLELKSSNATTSQEEALMGTIMQGYVGLANGLSRKRESISTRFEKLTGDERTRDVLPHLTDRAVKLAMNDRAENSIRLDALEFLRLFPYDVSGPTLLALAHQEANRGMQHAAIDGLTQYSAPEIAPLLLGKLKSQPPNIRRAILSNLLAQSERAAAMLDAVEAGEFSIRELDQAQARQLANYGNAEIRERAQKLIAAAAPADRKKVIDDYQASLKLKSDAVRGREIFAKNCTTCHKIGELGVNVAPDIADSRVTTPEALLVNILDPNRAIDNNYFSYTVITTEGKVLNGILAAETATSVTLKQPEGKTVTLLREEIDELHSDGVSLMPVGLEKNINPQQMADLISFIKNWRYLEADIPVSAGE